MRIALLLLPLGLLVTGCGGGDDGPVLTVDPPVHNFGRVAHGAVRITKFRVTNKGERDVEMVLKPNCGCFKLLDGGRQSLEPGESSEFRLRFVSGSVPPQVLTGKRIDILTDHPRGNTAIPLTGEIYRLATLKPGVRRVGRLGADASRFEPLRFRMRPSDGTGRLAVVSLNTTPPDVFDVAQEPVEGGVDLIVKQKADVRRPRGELNVFIDVRASVTSSQGDKEAVALRGRITGYWDVDTAHKKD